MEQVYTEVTRSLFERHKLMFAFTIATKLELHYENLSLENVM